MTPRKLKKCISKSNHGTSVPWFRLLTKYVFKSAIVKTNKLRVFQASLVQREVPRNEAEGL